MIIQDLFNLYSCSFIAERLALISDLSLKSKYLTLSAKIGKAQAINNQWVLERGVLGLRIKGVENSEDSFKMMSAEEIAGLCCSEIRPKLRDAIEMLEEYSFFRI